MQLSGAHLPHFGLGAVAPKDLKYVKDEGVMPELFVQVANCNNTKVLEDVLAYSKDCKDGVYSPRTQPMSTRDLPAEQELLEHLLPKAAPQSPREVLADARLYDVPEMLKTISAHRSKGSHTGRTRSQIELIRHVRMRIEFLKISEFARTLRLKGQSISAYSSKLLSKLECKLRTTRHHKTYARQVAECFTHELLLGQRDKIQALQLVRAMIHNVKNPKSKKEIPVAWDDSGKAQDWKKCLKFLASHRRKLCFGMTRSQKTLLQYLQLCQKEIAQGHPVSLPKHVANGINAERQARIATGNVL